MLATSSRNTDRAGSDALVTILFGAQESSLAQTVGRIRTRTTLEQPDIPCPGGIVESTTRRGGARLLPSSGGRDNREETSSSPTGN